MKIFQKFFKNDQKLNANEIAIKTKNNKYKQLDQYLASFFEGGSNENGNYLKLEDGTLIQYGVQSFSVNFVDYWSMKATNQFRINYPINFKEATSCIMFVQVGDNVWIFTQATSSDDYATVSQSQKFRFMHPTGMGDGNADISVVYFAIGKWK